MARPRARRRARRAASSSRSVAGEQRERLGAVGDQSVDSAQRDVGDVVADDLDLVVAMMPMTWPALISPTLPLASLTAVVTSPVRTARAASVIAAASVVEVVPVPSNASIAENACGTERGRHDGHGLVGATDAAAWRP